MKESGVGLTLIKSLVLTQRVIVLAPRHREHRGPEKKNKNSVKTLCEDKIISVKLRVALCENKKGCLCVREWRMLMKD